MRTPSLQRRVVLWSVSTLALLLLVVGVGVDLALGTVLKQEQQERLKSVAAFGSALTGLSDQSLANRLAAFGILVKLTDASGQEVIGTPQTPDAPGRGPKPPGPGAVADTVALTFAEEDGQLVATGTLRKGTTITLSSDSRQIDSALLRFRVIMAIASVVAVALAAVVLPLVLRRAMRPLGALTDAARDTAGGDRGRRLDPQDPTTDLGRAARQFDAMLEELEGAERRAADAADRLGRFLSDASHELRTPLAGVSAGAERLIRDPLDDEARDRVTVQVVREARRAARLVDDLLLVSRLGEIAITPVARPLAPLLREAADRARSRPGAPAIEVLGTDATVSVDHERLGQVLANLLTNAGNAGAGRIRVAAAVVADRAEVRVSDDGPGIAPADRDRVFERLVRLDPGRSIAGAGLGLPIARGLAAAQGGSLAVVDPADGDLPGAVLLLRLPLAPPPADSPRPVAPGGSERPLETTRTAGGRNTPGTRTS